MCRGSKALFRKKRAKKAFLEKKPAKKDEKAY